MPNITWCDLPEDVSLWPGLPLSLSGDEAVSYTHLTLPTTPYV